MIDPPPPANDIKIAYSVPFQPTLEQFNAMLKDVSSNAKNETWQDTGFVLRGDAQKVYWLSSQKARIDVELEVQRGGQNVVSAISILNAVIGSKATYLSKAIK